MVIKVLNVPDVLITWGLVVTGFMEMASLGEPGDIGLKTFEVNTKRGKNVSAHKVLRECMSDKTT